MLDRTTTTQPVVTSRVGQKGPEAAETDQIDYLIYSVLADFPDAYRAVQEALESLKKP